MRSQSGRHAEPVTQLALGNHLLTFESAWLEAVIQELDVPVPGVQYWQLLVEGADVSAVETGLQMYATLSSGLEVSGIVEDFQYKSQSERTTFRLKGRALTGWPDSNK